MKEIPLDPYPGILIVCETKKEFRDKYKQMTGSNMEKGLLDNVLGRACKLQNSKVTAYLVWGEGPFDLIHELTHCVLYLFEQIGVDPRDGNGEPFCYMMDHVMTKAGIKCT